MLKRVAILLLAVLAIQAYNTKNAEVGSGKDEVEKLYYKLLEYIGTAITEANTTCNEALDAVKEYATEIETAAKDSIQSALASFQAEMDEINAKAKKAGIDVTKCRKYEVQFSQLPDTLMDEILACVNNQINSAQAQVNDAMNKAQAIQQDFSTIKEKIDHCGSGFSSIICYAKLASEIEKDIVEGPPKIKTDINNTITIIKNAWPEIKQCATNSVEKVPSQAGGIVKDFAVCAAVP